MCFLFPAGNHVEAAAIQEIAGELRQIADLLERNVVARAAQNLSWNISHSTPEVSLIFVV